jgi:hypothetical protein
MKRYSILALAVLMACGTAALAQRPGITRMSPSPASLGRDRFVNMTPPVVMGTPQPFFAGAGRPNGPVFPSDVLPFRNPFFGAAINPAAINPFAFNSPFGFHSRFRSHIHPPYPYPYPMDYGYGSSYGSAFVAANTASPQTSGSDAASQGIDTILAGSGVPMQNGKVTWPLGLRLLRVDDFLKQLEAQLQVAAGQAAVGGVNGQLTDEIRDNVETIRQALAADKEWRFSMPLTVYEDSELFLRRLAKAPTLLQASTPAGRGQESRQLQTTPSQKKEEANPYPAKPD